jgi:transcriptional regulator with XRE-family HTH domain
MAVMIRNVERTHLDRWIEEHGPDGISKLAIRSEVSASTISKVRTGFVPAKTATRRALAEAIGIEEDTLFPLVAAEGKDEAS